MAVAARRRVVVGFSEPLLESADRAARELATTRSGVIRAAVEEFLKTRRRKVLEAELAAAYEANSDVARRLAEEFAYVD